MERTESTEGLAGPTAPPPTPSSSYVGTSTSYSADSPPYSVLRSGHGSPQSGNQPDRHPRSISLPSALHKLMLSPSSRNKGPEVVSTSTAAPSPSRYPQAPKRTVSESQSFDPNRADSKLSEAVEDAGLLTITESQHQSTQTPLSGLQELAQGFQSREESLLSTGGKAVQRALNTPDILLLIMKELDAMTIIPHELCQRRRKPMSLKHAQLIFGQTRQALDMWKQAQPLTSEDQDRQPAGLYNCLFVNSLWFDVAKKVMEAQIHFRNDERWRHFAWRGRSTLSRKPKALVLHKLTRATDLDLEVLGPENVGGQLEWLEFYTCPGLSPHPGLLAGGNLTRIVLPGCNRVSDHTMAHIAVMCPRLEHLDLRACELVTDKGLKLIARYCPQLQLLNVGRTRGGEAITYKAIKHLARLTQITTLGLAGCAIDDRSIWELAVSRGPYLQRLSLNNCVQLTDNSIPRVLGYMPNLTVLEIRNCTHITHMRPLALFKRYRERQGQPPLIEGCEIIQSRLQVAIQHLRMEISRRILADFRVWINEPDPEFAYE